MKAIFKETNEVIEVEPIFDRYLGEFICYQSGDFTKGNVKSYSKYELDFDTEKKDFDHKEFFREGQLIMTETIDWEERRFITARNIITGLVQNSHQRIVDSSSEELVRWSIETADELIKQLKEKRYGSF